MRSRNPFVLAAVAMAMVGSALRLTPASGGPPITRGPSRKPKPKVKIRPGYVPGGYRSGCGPIECARRVRQIRDGILTRSNGVVPEAFA